MSHERQAAITAVLALGAMLALAIALLVMSCASEPNSETPAAPEVPEAKVDGIYHIRAFNDRGQEFETRYHVYVYRDEIHVSINGSKWASGKFYWHRGPGGVVTRDDVVLSGSCRATRRTVMVWNFSTGWDKPRGSLELACWGCDTLPHSCGGYWTFEGVKVEG